MAMGPVTAIVLYLVIWFMVLFIVLPIRLETQGERGEVEPGTPEGAPANLDMWKKALKLDNVSKRDDARKEEIKKKIAKEEGGNP